VLDPSFTLPIGKAKIMREGDDLTIVTFSKMVGYALKAADELVMDGLPKLATSLWFSFVDC
jgi:pyruvate dehydrogenase E1 component beta subunit